MKPTWRAPSLATAGVFAAVAAWVWWYSGRFPPGTATTPGPAFYPRLAAGAMAALAAILGLLAVLGLDRIEWKGFSRAELRRWGIVVASTAAYVWLWRTAGYQVATFLFGAAFAYGFERGSPWRAALFGAILTAVMWALFAWGLGVPLQWG